MRKLLILPEILFISTSLACWLKTGPTDLCGRGFFITGASVQLLQLRGELRRNKNDGWGGGTEKENSEMDDGRSFRPQGSGVRDQCGSSNTHGQRHEGSPRW